MAIIALLLIICLLSSSYPTIIKAKGANFLECVSSNENAGELLHNIHGPTSQAYLSLLQSSTQNPRWIDSKEERPLFIASPAKEAEIAPIIKCSKMLGHQIRACSGGHDYEGLSFRSKTPFVMLVLSNLNRTAVNVEEGSAWIQTGVSLGRLYYEVAMRSDVLAFPGGLYPTVGAGGHISGGGLGTLVRKYGLAADNVLDARLMDSKGNILDRKSMGEDLFWAIRGGNGASFCVVLAWKLKLVKVPKKVTAFAVRRRLLDPSNLRLLQKWQNEGHRLSNDLFVRVLVQNKRNNDSFNGKVVQVTYNGLFLGPADQLGPELKKTFPEFGLEAEDCFGPPPVGSIRCSDEPCVRKECYQVPWIRSVLYFFGKKVDEPLEVLLEKGSNLMSSYKAKSDFLKGPIPDVGWEKIQAMFMSEERPFVIIDPFGGRMDLIPEDDTPFPHRKGNLFVVQYMTKWEAKDEYETEKRLEWIRKLYDEMRPYVAESPRTAYLNYRDLDLGVNDENYSYDSARVWGEKYFKGNFERLAKVKGIVDPRNFFRFEQSIPALV